MTDRIVFVFTIVLAAVYFWATAQIHTYEFGDPLGPKTFPRLLGVGLLIAAAMLAAEMWRARGKSAKGADAEHGGNGHIIAVGAVVVWTALYFLLFVRAGYVLATAVYLFALMAYFNRGKWLANSLTSVLFCVTTYFAFTKALGISLPRGILPF